MRILPFLATAAVATGLAAVLNFKMGGTPPLGKLLSPSHGFWKNAEPATVSFDANLTSDFLKEEVKVFLDDRLVPHVFAKNDADLYFAQGWLHARFRLWQMEFQTHAAAGRLSEILGEKVGENSVLELHDRKFRRMGMVYAAETALKSMKEFPEGAAGIEAYTAGVNHYISQLKPEDYPIEYKLLDYAPEAWTPLKSTLFFKYMSYDLSSDFDDFEMTQLLQKVGLPGIEKMFPIQPDSLDPILPKGTPFPPAFNKPVMPATADSLYFSQSNAGQLTLNSEKPDPDNGSNNWVVGGAKTQSGRPILCNDPHLGLSLPAIWFEMQLHTPEYNVYGVSFPGAPGVVIGFNDSIAWGVTNSSRDVMDFYEIKFKDSSMNEYWYDSSWKKTEWRTEVISIRGKADFVDKIPMTIWGPVMFDQTYQSGLKNGKAYSIRWKAHDKGLELEAFRLLNRAKNHADYLAAINQFPGPGQNFIFASKTNDIAWKQQARFPAKWRRQGDFILPGWDSSYKWQSDIDINQNIHVLNPLRGFISTANQLPADTSYPYYLGGVHDVYRGLIINRKLMGMDSISIADMQNLQTDNYNVFAEMALPLMLRKVQVESLTATSLQLLDQLKQWNYMADEQSIGMTIFFNWWNAFSDKVWQDEMMMVNEKISIRPKDETLLEGILKDTAYPYIDNLLTETVETLPEILAITLNGVSKNLTEKPESWAGYKQTRINHLLKSLEPFSRLRLPIGGGNKIINATKSTHGPSWRVVVQMTDTVEAYGVYPGGQNGNPGSKFYDQFVDTWAAGKYYPLWVMRENEKQAEKVRWTVVFNKN